MRHTSTGGGFTLIEVLVVVAIIALLVSILIPALTRARNEAQAAACGSNMRQAINGIALQQAENLMRRESWSTNFGWAVYSLKQSKGQTQLFTCPADPKPRPVPAILDRMYESVGGKWEDRGTGSGDGIFNRIVRDGNTWTTDLEDQVSEDRFAGDAYNDYDGDLLIQYTVSGKETSTQAQIWKVPTSSYRHDIMTYKGGTIAVDLQSSPVSKGVPLLWMSYSANASAGLLGAKGTPALIVEGAKFGVFPEQLSPTYPSDHLARALRFRHGSRAPGASLAGAEWIGRGNGTPPWPSAPPQTTALGGAQDTDYQPCERMNVGFIDAHVERLPYWRMFTLSGNPNSKPTPTRQIWFGSRRGGFTF